MIYTGDALSVLRTMTSESVNCIVTSPPYYGLRDYGHDGQIGLEPEPWLYVEKLVDVFREARRVLRKDGTLWLNLGDSYFGSGKGQGGFTEKWAASKQGTNKGTAESRATYLHPSSGRPKNLMGIPWRAAFALQDDGWNLRQDIIWSKLNPMPESVTDRCTKAHEYIFLLTKSRNYYFDAESISEPVQDSTITRCSQPIEKQSGSMRAYGKTNGPMKACLPRYGGKKYTENPDVFYRTKSGSLYEPRGRRNKRSVWTVANVGFKEAHFATYPPELIRPCIKSGCPAGGVVLDPFFGSGTTGVVAIEEGRQYIGIEINPEYVEIARRRILSTERAGVFDFASAQGLREARK